MTTFMAALDALLVQRHESRSTQFSATRNLLDVKMPLSIPADVFHLHWPAGTWGSRSFEIAGNRGLNVVQTLHDDFPFTGGCHSAGLCTRYETGCHQCPLVKPFFWALPSSSQRAKTRSASETRAVITAQSDWMLQRASKSNVFKHARTHKIPNVLSEIFLSEEFKRPPNLRAISGPIKIGFIAANLMDPNKGFDSSVKTLKATSLDFSLRAVGGYRRQSRPMPSGVELLGELSSSQLVEEAKTWDFLLVNSLNENAPNVISEMACLGVPTLSVNTGAIPEMINQYGLGSTFDRNVSAYEFRQLALDLLLRATPKNRALLSAKSREIHSAKTLHEKYLSAYGLDH